MDTLPKKTRLLILSFLIKKQCFLCRNIKHLHRCVQCHRFICSLCDTMRYDEHYECYKCHEKEKRKYDALYYDSDSGDYNK
uniref:Uncharacterized protein n=1 Tax=viral metagenome TaxID=1070528 RepID=A0A6C0CSZ2_9ZZZZ